MVSRRRRILLSEIERQSQFALMAYSDSTAALARRDADRFWYSLEGVVNAAAHLRQLLWPDPPAAWVAEVREELRVPDSSPLHQAQLSSLSSLTAALDAWNALGPAQPPLASNLGPNGFSEPAPSECVRCFAPSTSTFTLLGKAIELQPLLASIAELHHRAAQELHQLRAVV